MSALLRAGMVAALLLAAGRPASAAEPVDPGPSPGAECQAAIAESERAAAVPAGLMGSIAAVESGRADPRTGRVVPWPWTINVAGTGHFFATQAEAIAAVTAAQAAGVQSIDVGCMQINLLHHRLAFASLEQAFDPRANTAYAALFLQRLFAQSRSWHEAAASYHSATPGLREDYQRRVLLGWAGATRFGPIPAAIDSRSVGPGVSRSTSELRVQGADSAADHARWAAMGLVPAAIAPPARPTRRGSVRLANLSALRFPP